MAIREKIRAGGVSIGLIATGVILGVAAVWAVGFALDQGTVQRAKPVEYVTAIAKRGQVSDTLQLTVIGAWQTTPGPSNQSSGIVTSISEDRSVTHEGQVLFSVNLRPVVVAQGLIPSFRPIGDGAKGADVVQLQAFLKRSGFYQGATDGSASTQTVASVKAWQKSIGAEPDGVVQTGDVIWVPTLSVHYVLADTVKVGAEIAGGSPALNQLPNSPEFTIELTEEQVPIIPTNARVTISLSGSEWTGYTGNAVASENGSTYVLTLRTKDGAAICGDSCEKISLDGKTSAQGTVYLTEPTQGVIVPTAAVVTKAAGEQVVIDSSGRTHPITVLASAQGQSAIRGIAEGTVVRLNASTNG